MKTYSTESLQWSLGVVLKKIRTDQSLTQSKLAKITGLSQGLLSKIERGTTAVTMARFASLAHALGYQPSELLEKAEVITTLHKRQLNLFDQ